METQKRVRSQQSCQGCAALQAAIRHAQMSRLTMAQPTSSATRQLWKAASSNICYSLYLRSPPTSTRIAHPAVCPSTAAMCPSTAAVAHPPAQHSTHYSTPKTHISSQTASPTMPPHASRGASVLLVRRDANAHCLPFKKHINIERGRIRVYQCVVRAATRVAFDRYAKVNQICSLCVEVTTAAVRACREYLKK